MGRTAQKVDGGALAVDEGGKRGEDAAVGGQRIGEQEGDGDGGHQVGQEPDGFEGAAQLFLVQRIQEGGQQEADGQLQRNGENHHHQVVAEGFPKQAVGEQELPVVHADAFHQLGVEAVPLEGAQVEGIKDRIDDVNGDQCNGREQKNRCGNTGAFGSCVRQRTHGSRLVLHNPTPSI